MDYHRATVTLLALQAAATEDVSKGTDNVYKYLDVHHLYYLLSFLHLSFPMVPLSWLSLYKTNRTIHLLK